MCCLRIFAKIFILIIFTFSLLGCFATTHRGPAVLKPGQVSANVGYMTIKWSDADEDDFLRKQITIDGRLGILKFMDFGVIRTFDLVDYSNSATPDYTGDDAYWVDAKFQFSNLKNKYNSPQLSFGYGFGDYTADDDDEKKRFANSLYLLMGVPFKSFTPYYSYRYEYYSDRLEWSPDWAWNEDSDNITKAHIIGVEINAIEYIKPVIEVGRFYQDDLKKGYNVITGGLNFYLDIPKLLSSEKDSNINE